ncbi:MAG: ERCC4 domain-containing protein, partial [Nitrosarchaeum sp.]
YTDFIGKIVSGRLWDQMTKCKEASDDVYFLLENPYMQKFSKVSYKAIVAAKTSLSRHVKLFETRNATESFVFIKKLYDKYNSDDNKDFKEVRVKPKKMSFYEQARFMLLGLNGVGDSTVNKMFEAYSSLYEILRTKENELADVVGEKLANQIRNVLHATK